MITVFLIIISILAVVSLSYALPLATALYFGERDMILPFALPTAIMLIIATIVFFTLRNKGKALSLRQSYAAVALSWTLSSLFGAIPLYASGAISNLSAAIFESVSGFTTTGSTIISDIDNLPKSINLWRCLEHWLGGMGIVTLTVALLPLLGVGGFQLIKAETTGPEKGKVTPKIATTAKLLWFIYFGLTAAETILLKIAGMNFFDALCHAFATLGTGGFSTRTQSIGAYNSVVVDVICTVFMFFAGVNFSLYFYVFTGKLNEIKTNSEFKAYCAIYFITTVLLTLCIKNTYGTILSALRYAAFTVSSIITTTGFSIADYTQWSPAAQFLIFALFFVGGSSGSTAGGIKVVRWVIFSKQIGNEIKKNIHPHGVYTLRLNSQASGKGILISVTSFVFLYFALVIAVSFISCLFGFDVLTSITASLSMVGNIGPAFGSLGPSFTWQAVPSALKLIYSFAMLAGRLELYTMLIFFFPSFWDK